MDAIAVDGFHFDDGGKYGLSSGWGVRHNEIGLGSVGVMKGARVVLAEPRVLESVGAVNFVCVGKKEPEVTKGFVWDEFELGKGVLVSGRPSKVSDEGFVRGLCEGRRPHGDGRVVEAGWHC
jgi:hypothetical protein